MKLVDYRDLVLFLSESDDGDFEGPQPESLICEAEKELGIVFPESYRCFLLTLGCGDIYGFEIYGIINNDFKNSSIPDAIWFTKNQRESINLCHEYIIIGEIGDGSLYAIDTSLKNSDGESPVIILSVSGQKMGTIANSFGEYLLAKLHSIE